MAKSLTPIALSPVAPATGKKTSRLPALSPGAPATGKRASRLPAPSPVAPATGKKTYPGKKVRAGIIFLTANTYKRVPLFRESANRDIFFRELAFYRSKYAFSLYAYVLMPDHFHLLLGFPPEKSFAGFLRDLKSAVGRMVVDEAKQNNPRLLSRLRLPTQPERRRDALYCVLQPRSYVRAVTSRSMFDQKLDYIHANPVRDRLVKRAINYLYSSLRNYELGQGCITINPLD
ncbi:transposase [Acidobacteriia bacterium AH_259_A11_L15]|nr:transposase [Acidobacteriia bacterium AH_259_A11_L15]